MKAKIIQPPYSVQGQPAVDDVFAWELDALRGCTPDLDLIVLPECCDVPTRCANPDEYREIIARYNAAFLAAAAETARRCHAMLFANAADRTEHGLRNTTWAFDREGNVAGKYYKAQTTPSEGTRFGLDVSYTRLPGPPTIIEMEGLRFAFLTCYDFYFYENYASLARERPDIVIGCSHQRSDRHDALETFGKFIAYNTGAWLVRASVSMGEDSPLGGCSMVVSPRGEVLGNLYSKVGALTVEFDPHWKYLKPAGYGNPPTTHPAYVERGRRPWHHRPGGSAIAPFMAELPAKRLCAHRGLHGDTVPENTLPALAAATALGASEIEFDLWWTRDNVPVVIHDIDLERLAGAGGRVIDMTLDELRRVDMGAKYDGAFRGLPIATFEEAMDKLACHATINLHLKDEGVAWDEDRLASVIRCIDAHDARRHIYFMNSLPAIHGQLQRLAPDIPRCMGNGGHKSCDRPDLVDRAIECKCQMVQLFKPYFTQETVDRAHAAGMRVNVFWSDDPDEARRFLDMGCDTILTNRWLALHNALALP